MSLQIRPAFFYESAFSEVFFQNHAWKLGVRLIHECGLYTSVYGTLFLLCLYSRGEVCTMAPLHMHDGMKEHPLYEQSLLALATLTKVKVLMIIHNLVQISRDVHPKQLHHETSDMITIYYACFNACYESYSTNMLFCSTLHHHKVPNWRQSIKTFSGTLGVIVVVTF